MTPKQLGHRDAAWGTARAAVGQAVWRGDYNDAYDAVVEHRAKGLDPAGHPPRRPHLCERDVSKVCNCCETCSTACWAEKFEGTTERLKGTMRGLLRKVFK